MSSLYFDSGIHTARRKAGLDYAFQIPVGDIGRQLPKPDGRILYDVDEEVLYLAYDNAWVPITGTGGGAINISSDSNLITTDPDPITGTGTIDFTNNIITSTNQVVGAQEVDVAGGATAPGGLVSVPALEINTTILVDYDNTSGVKVLAVNDAGDVVGVASQGITSVASNTNVITTTPDPITATGTFDFTNDIITSNNQTSNTQQLSLAGGNAATGGEVSVPTLSLNKTLLANKTVGVGIQLLAVDNVGNQVGYVDPGSLGGGGGGGTLTDITALSNILAFTPNPITSSGTVDLNFLVMETTDNNTQFADNSYDLTANVGNVNSVSVGHDIFTAYTDIVQDSVLIGFNITTTGTANLDSNINIGANILSGAQSSIALGQTITGIGTRTFSNVIGDTITDNGSRTFLVGDGFVNAATETVRIEFNGNTHILSSHVGDISMNLMGGVVNTIPTRVGALELNKTTLADKSAGGSIQILAVDAANNRIGFVDSTVYGEPVIITASDNIVSLSPSTITGTGTVSLNYLVMEEVDANAVFTDDTSFDVTSNAGTLSTTAVGNDILSGHTAAVAQTTLVGQDIQNADGIAVALTRNTAVGADIDVGSSDTVSLGTRLTGTGTRTHTISVGESLTSNHDNSILIGYDISTTAVKMVHIATAAAEPHIVSEYGGAPYMDLVGGTTGVNPIRVGALELNKLALNDKGAGTGIQILAVDDSGNRVGYVDPASLGGASSVSITSDTNVITLTPSPITEIGTIDFTNNIITASNVTINSQVVGISGGITATGGFVDVPSLRLNKTLLGDRNADTGVRLLVTSDVSSAVGYIDFASLGGGTVTSISSNDNNIITTPDPITGAGTIELASRVDDLEFLIFDSGAANDPVYIGNNITEATADARSVYVGKDILNKYGAGISSLDNVMIGFDIMTSGTVDAAAKQNTVLIGSEVAHSATNVSSTVAIGYRAGYNIEEMTNNVILGKQAAIGNGVASITKSIVRSQIIGGDILSVNIPAALNVDDSIIVGNNAMEDGVLTVQRSISIGAYSGRYTTTFEDGVVSGHQTAAAINTNLRNVILGGQSCYTTPAGAASSTNTMTNSVIIGFSAVPSPSATATLSGNVIVGNASANIAGWAGINNVFIGPSSGNTLGTSPSYALEISSLGNILISGSFTGETLVLAGGAGSATGNVSISSIDLNRTTLVDKSAGANVKVLAMNDTNTEVGYITIADPADPVSISEDGNIVNLTPNPITGAGTIGLNNMTYNTSGTTSSWYFGANSFDNPTNNAAYDGNVFFGDDNMPSGSNHYDCVVIGNGNSASSANTIRSEVVIGVRNTTQSLIGQNIVIGSDNDVSGINVAGNIMIGSFLLNKTTTEREITIGWGNGTTTPPGEMLYGVYTAGVSRIMKLCGGSTFTDGYAEMPTFTINPTLPPDGTSDTGVEYLMISQSTGELKRMPLTGTDNSIVRINSTGGIQGSLVTINDSGEITATSNVGDGVNSTHKFRSNGSVQLWLEADTNNVDEADGPRCIFSQDGKVISSWMGYNLSLVPSFTDSNEFTFIGGAIGTTGLGAFSFYTGGNYTSLAADGTPSSWNTEPVQSLRLDNTGIVEIPVGLQLDYTLTDKTDNTPVILALNSDNNLVGSATSNTSISQTITNGTFSSNVVTMRLKRIGTMVTCTVEGEMSLQNGGVSALIFDTTTAIPVGYRPAFDHTDAFEFYITNNLQPRRSTIIFEAATGDARIFLFDPTGSTNLNNRFDFYTKTFTWATY